MEQVREGAARSDIPHRSGAPRHTATHSTRARATTVHVDTGARSPVLHSEHLALLLRRALFGRLRTHTSEPTACMHVRKMHASDSSVDTRDRDGNMRACVHTMLSAT